MPHAAALQPLLTRQAGIRARLAADQVRLISHLRQLARLLLPDAAPPTVKAVGELLDDATLDLVLDDLERLADAERTRLGEVSVDEALKEHPSRVARLERRSAEAACRREAHAAELARLDTDAFRWLRARRLQRDVRQTPADKALRIVTFARWREQMVETDLRESLGHEGFESAARAYAEAEKGLRRSTDEAERTAHAAAALRDLVLEHTDLEERVRTEPRRRLRVLRQDLEVRLVLTNLSKVILRAPESLRSSLAEAHAVEVRLRGWQDLDTAIDQLGTELVELGHPVEELTASIDRLIDMLANFHDFEAWLRALVSGDQTCCWKLLRQSAPEGDDLPAALLDLLIPRLHRRTVQGGPA
jgi:hypothetical protein